MKRSWTYFQKLNLPKFLVSIVLVGLLLLSSTACNRGDIRGARPQNPTVQAGGANNPYKSGGDGYTEYKMSNDPQVINQRSKSDTTRADLSLSSHPILAAANHLVDNQSKTLYPGSENISSPERARELREAAEVAAEQRQPVLIQTDPEAKLLEKTQKAIEEASEFLKDVAGSTYERPELQSNPVKNQ